MSKNSQIPGKTPEQARRAVGAQDRKVMREARTPQEQLKLLDSRPGAATKERRRLLGAAADLMLAGAAEVDEPRPRRRVARKPVETTE